MSNATARMTIGALFGTVTNAAGAVSSTIDAVSAGVGMLETFVDNAALQQRKRMAADIVDLDQRIAVEKGEQMAQREVDTLKFCSQSDFHKESFDRNYALIVAALKGYSRTASTASTA